MPDENTVEQLYAEHHKSLQRHVGRKLPHSQEAEDVAMNMRSRASSFAERRPGSLPRTGRVRPFLVGTRV